MSALPVCAALRSRLARLASASLRPTSGRDAVLRRTSARRPEAPLVDTSPSLLARSIRNNGFPLAATTLGSIHAFHTSPSSRQADAQSGSGHRDDQARPAQDGSNVSLVRSAITRLEAERRLAELGAKWSRFSGYDSIQELKDAVLQLENRLNQARANLDDSKRAYVEAVNLRSNSQKLINDLLSRKSSWSEDDLSSYTALLRSEHSQTRAETDSQSRYEQAERELQSAFDDLVRAVMRRYHEEQIWSDKVRNASSYASLVVAALNTAIIFVEPYKRRKLAETFEKRLLEGEAQGRALIQATIADFEARTAQAQEALTNEVRDGYGRILSTLGASPPPPTSDTVSSGLQRPTLPLAARLRVGLADEEKRNEWAVTSGLGALAGVAITLAFAFLAGGSAGGLPPGPGQ
ncbi:sensitivity to high expression protein she9 [Tilletia horrida]|nr:sensitivity to high expression protein she9 [Tilletia horrida]